MKKLIFRLSRRSIARRFAAFALENIPAYAEKLAVRLGLTADGIVTPQEAAKGLEDLSRAALGFLVDLFEGKTGIETGIDISKRTAVLALFDLAGENLEQAKEAGHLDLSFIPGNLEEAAFGWLAEALQEDADGDGPSEEPGALYRWAETTPLLG